MCSYAYAIQTQIEMPSYHFLLAVVSHPSFCASTAGGGDKGGLGRVRDRLSKETKPKIRPHAVWFNFSWRWLCQDCTGQGRRDTFTNCSGPSLICSGGSVNMTFSVCVQRQHKCSYLQVNTSMRGEPVVFFVQNPSYIRNFFYPWEYWHFLIASNMVPPNRFPLHMTSYSAGWEYFLSIKTVYHPGFSSCNPTPLNDPADSKWNQDLNSPPRLPYDWIEMPQLNFICFI